MELEKCEVSEEMVKQVVKRMRIGSFSKESLLPIVKAFQPEVWLMSHQIIDCIIADEITAGRIVEIAPGFWGAPRKSISARIRALFRRS